MPALSPKDLLLSQAMRLGGIVFPRLTLEAARNAKMPLALACAFLEQETAGGHNVFGHDPTIFGGAGEVTKQKYLAYKERRGPEGRGGMQGVGPMQLTFWSIQDEADARGGCWSPRINMEVGFVHAKASIQRNGLRTGIRAYNGSGPAAERYADQVLHRLAAWEKRLAGQGGRMLAPAQRVLIPRSWWKRFVFGDTDCERGVLTRLANVAKDVGPGVRVFVRSGARSRHEQEILYARFLRDGHPPTAKPGTSRETGKAADCQIVDARGDQANIGDNPEARAAMRRRGLCLPVAGEKWHVEIGTTWNA